MWEIYRGNAGRQARDTRCMRACGVEMHMDMSEEAFCAEIHRENAGRFSRGQRFVRACAVEIHMEEIYGGKCQTPRIPP